VSRVILFLAAILTISLATVYLTIRLASVPIIEILQPTRFIGRTAVFEATIETPRGVLSSIEAVIEQDDTRLNLFSLDHPTEAQLHQDSSNRIRITRTFDQVSHPNLHSGPARILMTATRPLLFGFTERNTTVVVDLQIKLEPPKLRVVSDFHYVNHGGSELVIYQVTPPEAQSGVQVGNRFYRGYSTTGVGIENDSTLHMAFFALSYDQELNTSIELYARDEAGNESRLGFGARPYPKKFRRAKINISNKFLRRVVPAILNQVPNFLGKQPDNSDEELLKSYLLINGELRHRNQSSISALANLTSPQMLWKEPFRQLANSKVESGFADHRTYLYNDNEIDQQIHLGFDLASTRNTPILSANSGTVVYADYLGIFGNCVVIDHGMGLQSLYAHLSSINVSKGHYVEQNQELGRSGQTGLAGGDHLHFTMLLQGYPVNPIEWWDPHWIEDRILLKLREEN